MVQSNFVENFQSTMIDISISNKNCSPTKQMSCRKTIIIRFVDSARHGYEERI